jgi:hypothetical protein
MDTQSAWNKVGELSEKKLASTVTFIDRVVTVSTSSLAFSITFRGSLLCSSPSHVWILKIAWIGLGISSIAGVFLHLAPASAYKSIMIQMKNNTEARGGKPHIIFKALYFLIAVTFPVGLASLMIFGLVNTN